MDVPREDDTGGVLMATAFALLVGSVVAEVAKLATLTPFSVFVAGCMATVAAWAATIPPDPNVMEETSDGGDIFSIKGQLDARVAQAGALARSTSRKLVRQGSQSVLGTAAPLGQCTKHIGRKLWTFMQPCLSPVIAAAMWVLKEVMPKLVQLAVLATCVPELLTLWKEAPWKVGQEGANTSKVGANITTSEVEPGEPEGFAKGVGDTFHHHSSAMVLWIVVLAAALVKLFDSLTVAFTVMNLGELLPTPINMALQWLEDLQREIKVCMNRVKESTMETVEEIVSTHMAITASAGSGPATPVVFTPCIKAAQSRLRSTGSAVRRSPFKTAVTLVELVLAVDSMVVGLDGIDEVVVSQATSFAESLGRLGDPTCAPAWSRQFTTLWNMYAPSLWTPTVLSNATNATLEMAQGHQEGSEENGPLDDCKGGDSSEQGAGVELDDSTLEWLSEHVQTMAVDLSEPVAALAVTSLAMTRSVRGNLCPEEVKNADRADLEFAHSEARRVSQLRYADSQGPGFAEQLARSWRAMVAGFCLLVCVLLVVWLTIAPLHPALGAIAIAAFATSTAGAFVVIMCSSGEQPAQPKLEGVGSFVKKGARFMCFLMLEVVVFIVVAAGIAILVVPPDPEGVSTRTVSRSTAAMATFRIFDSDADGFLQADELEKALADVGLGQPQPAGSQHQTDGAIFRHLDKNRDGTVVLEELERVLPFDGISAAVKATNVVTWAFTVEEDVSSFDAPRIRAMAETLAEAAGAEVSQVTVTISAASARVTVVIAAPTPSAAAATQSKLKATILSSPRALDLVLQTPLISATVAGITEQPTVTVTSVAARATESAGSFSKVSSIGTNAAAGAAAIAANAVTKAARDVSAYAVTNASHVDALHTLLNAEQAAVHALLDAEAVAVHDLVDTEVHLMNAEALDPNHMQWLWQVTFGTFLGLAILLGYDMFCPKSKYIKLEEPDGQLPAQVRPLEPEKPMHRPPSPSKYRPGMVASKPTPKVVVKHGSHPKLKAPKGRLPPPVRLPAPIGYHEPAGEFVLRPLSARPTSARANSARSIAESPPPPPPLASEPEPDPTAITPSAIPRDLAAPPPAPADEPQARVCSITVRCGAVVLRFILDEKLLARPLSSAVLRPFLRKYNKKVGESMQLTDVQSVILDGLRVPNVEVIAVDHLTNHAHHIEIKPPDGWWRLQAPKPPPPGSLPPDWNEIKDTASGNFYYHNSTTGATTWQHPNPGRTPRTARDRLI